MPISLGDGLAHSPPGHVGQAFTTSWSCGYLTPFMRPQYATAPSVCDIGPQQSSARFSRRGPNPHSKPDLRRMKTSEPPLSTLFAATFRSALATERRAAAAHECRPTPSEAVHRRTLADLQPDLRIPISRSREHQRPVTSIPAAALDVPMPRSLDHQRPPRRQPRSGREPTSSGTPYLPPPRACPPTPTPEPTRNHATTHP